MPYSLYSSTRLIDPLALPSLILSLVIYDKPKFLEIVLKSIDDKRFKTWLMPADDSHEISCLIRYFGKKRPNFKMSSAAIYGWRFKG